MVRGNKDQPFGTPSAFPPYNKTSPEKYFSFCERHIPPLFPGFYPLQPPQGCFLGLTLSCACTLSISVGSFLSHSNMFNFSIFKTEAQSSWIFCFPPCPSSLVSLSSHTPGRSTLHSTSSLLEESLLSEQPEIFSV